MELTPESQEALSRARQNLKLPETNFSSLKEKEREALYGKFYSLFEPTKENTIPYKDLELAELHTQLQNIRATKKAMIEGGIDIYREESDIEHLQAVAETEKSLEFSIEQKPSGDSAGVPLSSIEVSQGGKANSPVKVAFISHPEAAGKDESDGGSGDRVEELIKEIKIKGAYFKEHIEGGVRFVSALSLFSKEELERLYLRLEKDVDWVVSSRAKRQPFLDEENAPLKRLRRMKFSVQNQLRAMEIEKDLDFETVKVKNEKFWNNLSKDGGYGRAVAEGLLLGIRQRLLSFVEKISGGKKNREEFETLVEKAFLTKKYIETTDFSKLRKNTAKSILKRRRPQKKKSEVVSKTDLDIPLALG